ncbi:MAG: hypothetical protein K2O62_02100 [Clostridia bacterium]|nr:hypothetical protein [Clostridia bacterium]
MKDFKVEFNLADSEYMTALRLAVGAVCAAADTDVDGAEDMKVCVTESCLILKACGFKSVKITLNCKDGVHATVRGEGGEPKSSDNEFSLALISALVYSCTLEESGGVISGLVLTL